MTNATSTLPISILGAFAMSSSMVFFTLVISLAIAFAAPAAGDKPALTLPGTCPDFKPVATLDESKFTGDYYQVYALKKGIEKEESVSYKCVKHTNSLLPGGGFQTVMSFTKNGKPVSKTITGTPINGVNTKLAIKQEGDDEKTTPKTLTIIAAEPNSYYATLLCGSDGKNYGYVVQVFSQGKTLAAPDLTKVTAALKAINITDDLKASEAC